jgi:ABC-type nitrate/sulfonate/bicarbonate transport system substrate-binding protein
VRPVFTTVYGSIFGMAVPDGSDVQDPADLEGRTIGISDPAGGEVPIVRKVDAVGGSDFMALRVQGLELRPVGADTIEDLVADKVAVLSAHPGQTPSSSRPALRTAHQAR